MTTKKNNTTKKKNGIEIYQDAKGEWRFTQYLNGRAICASTEGYKNLDNCVDNIVSIYVETCIDMGWLEDHFPRTYARASDSKFNSVIPKVKGATKKPEND